jgi:hypothetical protein
MTSSGKRARTPERVPENATSPHAEAVGQRLAPVPMLQ